MLQSNPLSIIFCAFMLFNMTFSLPGPKPQDDAPVIETIYVDPEPHMIPAADLALINRTEGATGFYTPSAPVVPLELQPGVGVSFDNSTSGGLEKRAGWREFYAFTGNSCFQANEIFFASGFGCGVCVSWGNCGCSGANSVRLRQEWSGSPYPTASVFSNVYCSGSYQSVGISGTSSCTGQSSARYSAFLYWDC